MSPGDLGQVLCELPLIQDPNVLVGPRTHDDAAVYRLSDETALVQSVDVFTPVVDDPYTFGQVAAANALSDVYAMGARPILALSLIGFPVDKLPLSDMSLILKGGADKAREAGIDIAGGHSLDDNEPKFGLFVTGVVHPDRVITNAGAKPGDLLLLTKPLGIGVLTHCIKNRLLNAEERTRVVDVMARLNRAASEAMVDVGVSACTDITGFGLLGHLLEMLGASEVSARILVSQIPVLPGVHERVNKGMVPGGTHKNLKFYSPRVDWTGDVGEEDRIILADAQTSGGLLISVPRERVEQLKTSLEEKGVEPRAVVGEVLSEPPGRVEVVME